VGVVDEAVFKLSVQVTPPRVWRSSARWQADYRTGVSVPALKTSSSARSPRKGARWHAIHGSFPYGPDRDVRMRKTQCAHEPNSTGLPWFALRSARVYLQQLEGEHGYSNDRETLAPKIMHISRCDSART
jgi:hypothetical protein